MKTQSAAMFVQAKLGIVILLAISLAATRTTAAQAEEKPLHFVMIFRSTRTLTPDELHQRAGDLREWIGMVTSMGVTLNPRNLESRALQISVTEGKPTESEHPVDSALITMVFFDVTGWDQAEQIARMHPGPRYGSVLELREWVAPAPLVH